MPNEEADNSAEDAASLGPEVRPVAGDRARTVLAVLHTAAENPELRRLGSSYALCCTAELGIWMALLIYAYGHGGTAAGATIVLVQLVPCIVLGPFLGAVADLRDPQRVLIVGMVAEVVSMGAVAVAMAWAAPDWVVVTLAPLTALSITLTRPTQAALFPAVVRTPEELTAANVMSGWTYGVACLIGPALAGALVVLGGTASGGRRIRGPRRLGPRPGGPLAPPARPRAVLERSGECAPLCLARTRRVPWRTAGQPECCRHHPRGAPTPEPSRLLLRACRHDRPALRGDRDVLPPHGCRGRRLPECRHRRRGGRRRIRDGLPHRAAPAQGPAGAHIGRGRCRAGADQRDPPSGAGASCFWPSSGSPGRSST